MTRKPSGSLSRPPPPLTSKTDDYPIKEIPLKILIVDDSSTMRRIIINTLSRIGYTDVVEGEHGKAGLEKLAQGGVEMIITDWNMPRWTDSNSSRRCGPRTLRSPS